MEQIEEEVRLVAIGLCKADRLTDDARIMISPGFCVPRWLTYYSRAELLVRERKAFK